MGSEIITETWSKKDGLTFHCRCWFHWKSQTLCLGFERLHRHHEPIDNYPHYDSIRVEKTDMGHHVAAF